MSERRLIDTNLIVRHLVQDNKEHAKIAARLFEACDRGEITLVVLPEVVSESVFVLESFYKKTRAEIGETLGALVGSPGIELTELAIHLDALERYRNGKMHFVDCVVAATAVRQSLSVATFDAGFKKIPNVIVDVETVYRKE